MIAVVTRFKKPRDPNKRREKTAQEKREGMSKQYLATIRTLPSCVSGKGPCEAHHLRISKERGVGMKATDKWAVPLTPEEHREVHKVGSRAEAAWFRKRGIQNVYELAAGLWANKHSEEAMLRVIQAHREPVLAWPLKQESA